MTTTSPFDTFGTDTTIKELTSFKITKLVGQLNFAKWERDLKVVAQYLDLWDYITNKATVLTKPSITAHLEGAFQHVIKQCSTKTEPAVDKEGKKIGENRVEGHVPVEHRAFYQTLQVKQAEKRYDMEMAEYNKQELRINKALTLLRLHVSDSIRAVLNSYSEPTRAFKYLEGQYRLSNYQILQTTHRNLEQLNLKMCKDLNDFFSRLEEYIIKLKEVGGSYDSLVI